MPSPPDSAPSTVIPRHPTPSLFPVDERAVWARGPGVTVWLVEPSTMLTVIDLDAHVGVEVAELMIESTYDALHRMIDETGRASTFVHDFRGMVSHDSRIRAMDGKWPLRFGRAKIEAIHVMVNPAAPRLARMAASGVEMAIALLGFRYKTYWSSNEFVGAIPSDVSSGMAKAMLRSGARVPMRRGSGG